VTCTVHKLERAHCDQL